MKRLLAVVTALISMHAQAIELDPAAPMALRLPPTSDLVIGGSVLAAALEPLTIKQREVAVLELFQRGYIPDSLRQLKAIEVKGKGHRLTYWVTPDYLSLGHDFDYVLMPLSWTSVKKLAHSWGFVLPTPRMVDQIFHSADRRIWPRALPPTRDMVEMPYIIHHSKWIQAEEALQPEPDFLFAGHKKDIVMSSQLLAKKDRIAIYGWQNIVAGENIQPLCLWHGKNYVDYSHGVRMVAKQVLLNGKMVGIDEVLGNPETAGLLSDEGDFSVAEVMRLEKEEPVVMALSAKAVVGEGSGPVDAVDAAKVVETEESKSAKESQSGSENNHDAKTLDSAEPDPVQTTEPGSTNPIHSNSESTLTPPSD